MLKPDKESRTLALAHLASGWPKLSAAMGQVLAESASVCLHDQGHDETVQMSVSGAYEATYSVQRLPVTDQMSSTHSDLQDATEWGACGIAILLIDDLTSYTIVERAWKGGGFDYWLGNKTDPLFQKRARLEVSGILHGEESTIKTRIKQKLRQSNPSDDTQTSAYAAVVEFSAPMAWIKTK